MVMGVGFSEGRFERRCAGNLSMPDAVFDWDDEDDEDDDEKDDDE